MTASVTRDRIFSVLSARIGAARVRALVAIGLSGLRDAEEPHSYSSTQVDLPKVLADAIISLQSNIPDSNLAADGKERRPHVTVKYGLLTDDPEIVKPVLANFGPVVVRFGWTAMFEGEDADVLYVEVVSPGLNTMNAALASALDHVDTHPTYTPHATVTYLKSGVAQSYIGKDTLVGYTAIIDHVMFIAKDGTEYVIPLQGMRAAGGPGSGNFGHSGRPGEIGGSGGTAIAAVLEPLKLPPVPAPVPQPQLTFKPTNEITATDFIGARNTTTRPGYLSPLKPADLQGSKLYMDTKHQVGGALTASGDMENLFNNGGPQRAATEVLLQMLQDGGKTADAFDGYLPKLYANFGLVETGRMKFNPEYAPPGWNFDRDDHPDVVFLSVGKDVGTPKEIRDRVYGGTQKEWTPRVKTTKYFTDYDEGKQNARHVAENYLERHALPRAAAESYTGRSGDSSHDDSRFRTRVCRPDGRGHSRTGAADWRPVTLGGAGSGNFGHSGRPGEIGGSSDSGGTSNRGSVKALKTGKITSSTLLDGSNNEVLVVHIDDNGHDMKAIFKPVSGEAWTEGEAAKKIFKETVGIDHADASDADISEFEENVGVKLDDDSPVRETIINKDFSYAEREAAAYDVDEALGLGVTPATTIRTVNGREGATQAYVEYNEMSGILDSDLDQDSIYGVAILDIATGNTDRHAGNILVDGDKKLVAIDHGLTFPEDSNTNEFRPDATAAALGMNLGPMSDAMATRTRERLESTDWKALAARRWPNMNLQEQRGFMHRIDELKQVFDPDIYSSPSRGVRELLYTMADGSTAAGKINAAMLAVKKAA